MGTLIPGTPNCVEYKANSTILYQQNSIPKKKNITKRKRFRPFLGVSLPTTWWLDFAKQIHPEKLDRWWLNQPIPEKIVKIGSFPPNGGMKIEKFLETNS